MQISRFILTLVISVFLTAVFSSNSNAQLPPENFPVDDALRVRVDFWKKVYTEIHSGESFLHDSNDLSIVYEKYVYGNVSGRALNKLIKERKSQLKEWMLSIVAKKREGLTEDETKLLPVIAKKSDEEITEMADNIRHQQGMSDRYLQGLERSQIYLEQIKMVFKELGLPEHLAFLPHVESSFNYQAYSKVGAAGIWQFMRSTARLYDLKLNYIFDERRDPIASTRAAAHFLRDNYTRLQSWPLALTAYNHGPVSIERAVQTMGTRDISVIIDRYQNRKFGFASKNFYATFVAAAELSENPYARFPALPKMDPIQFTEIEIRKPMSIRYFAETTGIPKEVLQKFNPGFRPAVFVSSVMLPAKTMVKTPVVTEQRVKEWYAKLETAPTAVLAEQSVKSKNPLALAAKLLPFRKKAEQPPVLPVPALAPEPERKIAVQAPGGIFNSLRRLISPPSEEAEELAIAKHFLPPFNPSSYHFETPNEGDQYLVTVESDETLGHLADWAGVSASQIRKANRLKFGDGIAFGKQLKVPVSQERLAEFNTRRLQYHQALEEDLFNTYRVEGTTDYRVRTGDTLSDITRRFEVPQWLLRKYQDSPSVSEISVGQVLKIPQLVAISSSAPAADANAEQIAE